MVAVGIVQIVQKGACDDLNSLAGPYDIEQDDWNLLAILSVACQALDPVARLHP